MDENQVHDMGYLIRKADAFLREWKQNPCSV